MRASPFSRTLLAAAFICLASAARADSVDGDWCNTEGKHLVIKGTDITLPDGTQLQGSNTRHSFAYVVPASQTPAGGQMLMRLVNEETMIAQVYRGGTLPVTWKRCEHVS